MFRLFYKVAYSSFYVRIARIDGCTTCLKNTTAIKKYVNQHSHSLTYKIDKQDFITADKADIFLLQSWNSIPYQRYF